MSIDSFKAIGNIEIMTYHDLADPVDVLKPDKLVAGPWSPLRIGHHLVRTMVGHPDGRPDQPLTTNFATEAKLQPNRAACWAGDGPVLFELAAQRCQNLQWAPKLAAMWAT